MPLDLPSDTDYQVLMFSPSN